MEAEKKKKNEKQKERTAFVFSVKDNLYPLLYKHLKTAEGNNVILRF